MTLRQRFNVSLFAVAALAATAVAQQQSQPQQLIQRIVLSRVKPDRVADFQAAVRESVATMKRDNAKHGFTLWLSLTGEREYARVDTFTSWGALDNNFNADLTEQQRSVLANFNARIIGYFESSRTVLWTVPPNANMTAGQPLPPMVLVQWFRLQYGKRRDFMSLATSEGLPLAKKAGINFTYYAALEFGDDAPQVAVVTGLPNWGALDKNPFVSLEGYADYLKKIGALITNRNEEIYRFLPELSYTPAPVQSALK